ncbi:ATP-binding protein [Micrococcus sp. NPDC078436]|uniref:ATP-binding protein n=1 Tax=Micrococcus sp. NPDC078436 TaxID=3154960 RepID=UPI00344F4F95
MSSLHTPIHFPPPGYDPRVDPTLNPYSPGSGIAPPFLAGRDADLSALASLIHRVQDSRSGRGIILSGLRGVGKTVLLNRLRGMADEASWLTIQFEARPGKDGAKISRQTLGQGLQRASLTYRAKAASEKIAAMLDSIRSLNVTLGADGFSVGIEKDAIKGATGSLEVDFQSTMEAVCLVLRDEGKGFALFIDEMQDLDKELMQSLIVAQHYANQRELPFFVIGAGLPSLPARLSATRSYAERLFQYRPIGRLRQEEAEESLERPAEREGAAYTSSALEILLKESGQYPYFLQEFGSALWEIAQDSPFTEEAARAAAIAGKARLDAGFFPSRWDRATPGERDYLIAMAQDGEDPSRSGIVADRLGKAPQGLGLVRAKLIEKGLIYAPERGQVAFTVPGMADYIARISD